MEWFGNLTNLQNSSNEEGQLLQNQSLQLLRSSLIPNSFWFIIGFGSAVTSFLVCLTIGQSKSLRSKYYINCLHLALANLLFGAILCMVGLKRLILYLSGTGEVSSPLRCFLDSGGAGLGMMAQLGQNLAMTIDRFLAIFFPLYYVSNYKYGHSWLNWIIWLIVLITWILFLVFTLNPTPKIPACIVWLTFTKTMKEVCDSILIIYVILIVLLNLAVFCKMKREAHRRIHMITQNPAPAIKVTNQNHLTKVVLYIVITDVFVWMLSQQLVTRLVGHMASGTQQNELAPYTALAPVLNGILNFLFYFKMDGGFKLAFFKIFLTKTDEMVKQQIISQNTVIISNEFSKV